MIFTFSLLFIFFLLFMIFLFEKEKGFLSIKRPTFSVVMMESFWAGRIFSLELIKKLIVEFLDMLGFSVVILCFHKL